MNLLMIRHGEIPSNVNKVYAGKSPESLTERGVQQAIQVSEKLKSHKIEAVYSSPIQRALQTAQIIVEDIGIDLTIEDAFREMELGPWEGLSETYVAQKYPKEWDIWNTRPADLKLPGRETLDNLLYRVLAGIKSVYNHSTDSILVIVTHVAVIRVLILWSEKKSLNLYKTIHVPNAKIFNIKVDTCPSL